MYSINPFSRNTLITPDECTKKIPNTSLDSVKWISAIELAEVRFVLPLLGWNLYNDICNKKNIIVDSGNISSLQDIFIVQFGTDPSSGLPKVVLSVGMIVNSIELITITPAYASLWNYALWNYVFNCVYFIAMTENYAEFSSSGLQKNNPIDNSIGSISAKSVGISLEDLRFLNNRWLLDRINPLQEYTEKWICANINLFTLYPSCNCSKWNKENLSKRTSSFINIYEEDCEDELHWNNNCNNQPIPIPTPQPIKTTCSIYIQIKSFPDGSLYLLCNLQTIQAQYSPSLTTLTLPNLVNKYVNVDATYNGQAITILSLASPDNMGYNQSTGTFDRTPLGGFNDGDTFSFLYTETT